MNKRMHIRGIHIVFLIPGSGRQYDIGEETGAGHAEVERHQQVELAFQRFAAPLQLFRAILLVADRFALNAALGAEQIAQHILVPFARGAEQVRAPDKHVARVVAAVVGIFARHAQLAGLQRLDGPRLLGLAGAFRLFGNAQRVDAELWR